MGGCGKGGFLKYIFIHILRKRGLFSISPSFGSLLTPFLIYVDDDDDDDDWVYRP
jgi:hypothetical protein